MHQNTLYIRLSAKDQESSRDGAVGLSIISATLEAFGKGLALLQKRSQDCGGGAPAVEGYRKGLYADFIMCDVMDKSLLGFRGDTIYTSVTGTNVRDILVGCVGGMTKYHSDPH